MDLTPGRCGRPCSSSWALRTFAEMECIRIIARTLPAIGVTREYADSFDGSFSGDWVLAGKDFGFDDVYRGHHPRERGFLLLAPRG